MIIDAREIDSGVEIDADLCIIGAGAAGITIARTFEASGVSVCLIESGGLAYDERINSLYRGQLVGHSYWPLHECQFRAFGGNTNCWGGWSRPLDGSDFQSRPWIEHSGWPFGFQELEPYYGRAHEVLQIQSDSYDLEAAAAKLIDAQWLSVDPQLFENHLYRFSPPTRFRHTYFDDINKSSNIRCFLHANVTNIETSHDGKEVLRVQVGCLDGSSFSVSAKNFVMSAGGTENARLLLNSRDQMACGLGNSADIVGRFFMEHPHTARKIIAKAAPFSMYTLNYYGKGDGTGVSARLSLTPAQQEAEGILAYSANVRPLYMGCDGAGWQALRKIYLVLSKERKGDPFLRFPPYGSKRISPRDIWEIVRTLPKTTAAGFLSLFHPNRFLDGYILESKSEQAPNPDSRVLLQHERDAFGLNRVALDWRTLPIDRHTVIRAEEIVDAELRRLNIGTLEPLTEPELAGWPTTGLGGGWHQLGTTRMSDDPHNGVVDRHARVHGISNLFIAGGSIFPTVGAVPPTLTIVALALRLADHLMHRFDRVSYKSVSSVAAH